MVLKIDKDTALAKIKVLISLYFEKVGRGEVENDYNGEIDLIHDIDNIIDDTDIDVKNIIIEKLELDKTRHELDV